MLFIFQMIFLVLGSYMLYTGKIELGNIRREGENVRKAGAILIAPIAIGFLIGYFFVGLLGGGSNISADSLIFISLVDFALTIGAFIFARRLVFDAPEMGTSKPNRSVDTTAEPKVIPTAKILNVAEAAQYLDISEGAVMNLIDNGDLPAARVGGSFQIARIVLDEYASR